MKKRFFRLSKRILILMLCTTLISGSVVNKYKITANATTIAASFGVYSMFEICKYVGLSLLAVCGLGVVIENGDEIAELGKNFIDSIDLTNESGWMFTKVTTTGQSYVFGTEALQEIQDTSFSVIQGGGNRPDDDDDNNNDDEQGDGEHMVDVLGLSELAVFGTVAFYDLFERYAEPLIEGMRNGEENFVTDSLGLYNKINNESVPVPDDWASYKDLWFDGTVDTDSSGNYVGTVYSLTKSGNYSDKYIGTYSTTKPIFAVHNGVDGATCYYSDGTVASGVINYQYYRYTSGSWVFKSNWSSSSIPGKIVITTNIPLFNSHEAGLDYFATGNTENIINLKPKIYQIADWLQENWTSTLEQLNTGIRSLNDNMLIVGEAANQALINQSNGLGYIEDLGNRIATTAPLALPDSIADPIYYPADSSVPKLAPEELPWNDPVANPDSPEDEPPYDPDISEVEVWEVIHGTDTFGLNTLFGILILLIMILIMLLFIFLSCLAFIIMIFRIPAQTGFLPEEMIAALNYLKTLQIPGFGMSVYGFFMALIYILLIFTVIGILRKNIDKIKFPRKGRR